MYLPFLRLSKVLIETVSLMIRYPVLSPQPLLFFNAVCHIFVVVAAAVVAALYNHLLSISLALVPLFMLSSIQNILGFCLFVI